MRKIVVFMKKYVFISLLTLVASVFMGCKNDSPKCNCQSETLDLTVLSEDWSFDEETLQFYYRFDVPELTAKVYNYGNWTISREYNKGTDYAYQVALPMSVYCHDTLSDNSVVYYTRHTDYRVGYGYVDIQVTDSDFPYAVDPSTGKHQIKGFTPEDMFFRMQLLY